MTARTDRIDELLRQEIGAILAKDVQDPRIGFVTVTEVETAPDLSTARVWVSLIGQPADREQSIKALQHALPFVRHELGSRIRLRRIPELQLRTDDTAQRGTRVLQLLAELEAAGGAPVEPPPVEESLPTPTFQVPVPPAPAPRRKRKTGPRKAARR
jgi:ribosome-binding factor A